jgi:hypothetical protein
MNTEETKKRLEEVKELLRKFGGFEKELLAGLAALEKGLMNEKKKPGFWDDIIGKGEEYYHTDAGMGSCKSRNNYELDKNILLHYTSARTYEQLQRKVELKKALAKYIKLAQGSLFIGGKQTGPKFGESKYYYGIIGIVGNELSIGKYNVDTFWPRQGVFRSREELYEAIDKIGHDVLVEAREVNL